MRKIAVFVFAAVMLSSCREEPCIRCLEEQQGIDEKINYVQLYVMPSPATKVMDATAEKESCIHSVILYVFDSHTGEVITKYRDSTGCFNFTIADGQYDFATLVNTADTEPTCLNELRSTVSCLSNNKPDSFVMYGLETSVDIITSRYLSVTAHRLVAKVNYSVSVDWNNQSFSDYDFIVKGAYMTNVCGEAAYDNPGYTVEDWYNKMFNDASQSSLFFGNESCSLSNKETLESEHTFYIYPNKSDDCHDKSMFSPRCTRLVVEAMLSGETYYYPVTIPEVISNTAYDIKLTVKGPGMEHPEDENIASGSMGVAIGVYEWETGETINAEF